MAYKMGMIGLGVMLDSSKNVMDYLVFNPLALSISPLSALKNESYQSIVGLNVNVTSKGLEFTDGIALDKHWNLNAISVNPLKISVSADTRHAMFLGRYGESYVIMVPNRKDGTIDKNNIVVVTPNKMGKFADELKKYKSKILNAKVMTNKTSNAKYLQSFSGGLNGFIPQFENCDCTPKDLYNLINLMSYLRSKAPGIKNDPELEEMYTNLNATLGSLSKVAGHIDCITESCKKIHTEVNKSDSDSLFSKNWFRDEIFTPITEYADQLKSKVSHDSNPVNTTNTSNTTREGKKNSLVSMEKILRSVAKRCVGAIELAPSQTQLVTGKISTSYVDAKTETSKITSPKSILLQSVVRFNNTMVESDSKIDTGWILVRIVYLGDAKIGIQVFITNDDRTKVYDKNEKMAIVDQEDAEFFCRDFKNNFAYMIIHAMRYTKNTNYRKN